MKNNLRVIRTHAIESNNDYSRIVNSHYLKELGLDLANQISKVKYENFPLTSVFESVSLALKLAAIHGIDFGRTIDKSMSTTKVAYTLEDIKDDRLRRVAKDVIEVIQKREWKLKTDSSFDPKATDVLETEYHLITQLLLAVFLKQPIEAVTEVS